MSTEAQKPVIPTEGAAPVEPTAAPVEPIHIDKPVEPLAAVEEPKAEEPAKTEPEAVPAAAEEKKEEKAAEKPAEKPVEPIYSGALGYKAPGLKNAFRFSKKYFWFGDEAVPVSSLSHYLRGEKADVAHHTAAWSSQTGKGLLYFVKHADEKSTPAGVLNLSEATDLSKDGTIAFFFKLHGQKHTFEAQTAPERNGWFVAVEKAVEEAKAAKEGIVASEGFKEEKAKLDKPTLGGATKEATPKKSTDVAPKLETTEAAPAEASAPVVARAGSASSSSADENKKAAKAKSKSRSVSRGKRASIFSGILGKKEKVEEKVAEKKEAKEEKKEEKEEETTAPPTAEASTAAAVATEETSKPTEEAKVEEPKAEEPVAATAAATTTEEKKAEEKPKPAKRGSIFGNFVEKLRSPTTEKKESEAGLASPAAKESEVTAEAPKLEETPAVEAHPLGDVAAAAPAVDGTTEAPKTEEAKETKPAAHTPSKEKQHFSFGKFLGGAKDKVKSPTTEHAPEAKTEESAKTEETPAVAAPADATAEPTTEAAKEEKKEETPAATTETTPAAKSKRGSIFGNLTGSVKKEKEGDSEKPRGLGGLFRNASKAGKTKKEKEATSTPPKVEETTEPKEEEKTTEVAPKEETPAIAAPTEPNAIGDVPADAVQVGQAPKSTPQVSTTA